MTLHIHGHSTPWETKGVKIYSGYRMLLPKIVTFEESQGLLIIYLFRGACAVKGNVQVAGHVKRADHGAAFYA